MYSYLYFVLCPILSCMLKIDTNPCSPLKIGAINVVHLTEDFEQVYQV